MKGIIIPALGLAALTAAQGSSESGSGSATRSFQIITLSATRSYRDYLPEITLPSGFQGSAIATIQPSSSGSSGPLNATISASNSSTIASSRTSSGEPVTNIGGLTRTTTAASTRSAPPRPVNTQPCNNYVELCSRKYSNITEVCAHNSPFTRENNAARNQIYSVTQQLNDGIRMLQGQAHMVDGTLYYCHTSCDLLNQGTVEDYLREVTAWVETHPFDVVTILFGNYNWADKDSNGNRLVTAVNFDAPVRSSGLIDYVYHPPKTAMTVDDWPILGQMILQQKRVVTFIDYNFDTEEVPYMLWEFYSIWETPFSPTNFNFPCTIGRPDGVSDDQAKNMMYIANHNLNAEIAIAGTSILVPNTALINETNAVTGNGSLGRMANECAQKWGRPPNFLLVDFYNYGPIPGSVFEAAARANGVTYNRPCCRTSKRSLAATVRDSSVAFYGLLVAVAAILVMQV